MSQKILKQMLEEIKLNNHLLRRIERHQEMKVRKK
jgi:hypothetical protein